MSNTGQSSRHRPVEFRTAIMAAVVSLLSACGDVDPGAFPDTHRPPAAPTDTDTDVGTEAVTAEPGETDEATCPAVAWGLGCDVDAPTYNIAFEGLTVSEETEGPISLEALHCAGYDAAVLIIGDARCSACPARYREIGNIADAIHESNAAIITACTDGFGADTLTHAAAHAETEAAQPDYVTGSRPLAYPCRYTFTPFTVVVDLSNARILGMDSLAHSVTPGEILSMVAAARSE